MPDKTRAYHMQVRAQSQEETRLRITESAMELHGTLGPSRTSISAVAALAGVRRSTVYRHFPDEAALFDACSAHWFAQNPPPDLGAWANIASPEERLGVAVGEIFAFYRRTESMLENLFRDEATVPLIAERFAAFRGYLGAARATLMAGRKIRGAARRRTGAALGHAIAFSTWQSLARDQGLSDSEAGELVRSMVAAAGGGGGGDARAGAREGARGGARGGSRSP